MTWLKRALPVVALLGLLNSPSLAQIAGRPFEFSAGAGLFAYDTRAHLEDGPALTGSLGMRLAPWFTAELGGAYGRTEVTSPAAPNASLTLISLDARFNLRPAESRVVPFAIAGFGYGRSRVTDADPEKLERGTPSLGGGALINLLGKSPWYVRLQARDVMFKERGSLEFGHDVAVTAAIHYVWRGKVKDTDLDGVRDWIDHCPATDIGATVDASGCPKDADGDGVWDGIDKCADTPKGCKVDAAGCPIDTDGDGVCDGRDSCASTPKGAKVNDTGCPIDSDGDGVADGIDECPNTPKECTVDAKGCPADADADGVCDALDKCANTPAGALVDATGCETSASQLEGDMLDTGRLIVSGLTFAPGSSTLSGGASAKLDDVGAVLSKWPELNVEIAGNTDSKEAKPNALVKLSKARADAVVSYLTGKFPEIKSSQLTVKALGSSKPVASNASDAGRTLNRRVEFNVTNKSALVKAGGKRRLGAH